MSKVRTSFDRTLDRRIGEGEVSHAIRLSLAEQDKLLRETAQLDQCLRERDREMQEILRDGNCLFRCLEKACRNKEGHLQTFYDLRSQAVRHIAASPQFVMPSGLTRATEIRNLYAGRAAWASLDDGAMMENYARFMGRNAEYGTAFELTVLVTELYPSVGHATVFMIGSSNAFQETKIGLWSRDNIFLSKGTGIELVFMHGNHYNIVRQKPSASAHAIACHVPQLSRPPLTMASEYSHSSSVSNCGRHAIVLFKMKLIIYSIRRSEQLVSHCDFNQENRLNPGKWTHNL